MVTQVISCPHCASTDILKNGFAPNNSSGKQKYLCHSCGRHKAAKKIPLPTAYYTEEQRKEEILRAYQEERSSLRALRRTFGVSPTTVISWLKKSSRA